MRIRELKGAVGLRYRRAEGLLQHRLFERGLPHDTSRRVELDTYGLQTDERHRYQASGWTYLPRGLRGEEITLEHVFLELGCGMGRVVRQAARRYPFRRVIGVDISPDLVTMARENIASSGRRLRTRHVEIVEADVTAYAIPDEVTHVYLFSPFTGATFDAVAANLVASLDRHPRELTIVYAFPQCADALIATGRFALARDLRGVRRKHPVSRVQVLKSAPAAPSALSAAPRAARAIGGSPPSGPAGEQAAAA